MQIILKHMKCFSDGRKYMKKWTLTEFFWKSKLAFFGLSDGTNFKILRRFFGFLLFFGRKTPPDSADVVLKNTKLGITLKVSSNPNI